MATALRRKSLRLHAAIPRSDGKAGCRFHRGSFPAIAIEQRRAGAKPRSTIAATTEVYSYLGVLFSAVGQPQEPSTGGHLKRLTITAISPRTPTSTASLPLIPPDYSGRSPLVAHRQIQFFIWTRRSISLRPEYRRNAASGRFHYFLGNLGVYIVTPLSQITT